MAPHKLNNGCLIIFEGIDGVGKTTQLELAKATLEAEGWPVYTTRNLGGTPIGEALRSAILQPLPRPCLTDVYVSAAIQEALIESIETERAKGSIILLDRGPLSLVAYQVFGSGADAGLGWKFADLGMQKLSPDLVLIYDTSPDIAQHRLKDAGKNLDYFESKPRDYFRRVAHGYHEAAKRYKATIIDSTESADDVFVSTKQLVQEALAAQA